MKQFQKWPLIFIFPLQASTLKVPSRVISQLLQVISIQNQFILSLVNDPEMSSSCKFLNVVLVWELYWSSIFQYVFLYRSAMPEFYCLCRSAHSIFAWLNVFYCFILVTLTSSMFQVRSFSNIIFRDSILTYMFYVCQT